MSTEETIVYNVEELENYMITETLITVMHNLNEKGYNGINQIVGYLLSGDLAYISSYKESRNKMQRLEREKVLEALLKHYLRDVRWDI